jgi:branched-chain amino acid transport system permease protein
MKRSAVIPIAVSALLIVAVQLLTTALGKSYYLTQLIMSAYYAIVVLGLCLVMGYAGQISLGHAAFFAIGGYTSAVLTTRPIASAPGSAWGAWLQKIGVLASRPDLYGSQITAVTPWAAFLVALLLAMGAAVLIGYPSLRLRGHYLAMATLGFGLIVYRLVLGSRVTGASDGITGVPPWHVVTLVSKPAGRIVNYYLAWGFVLVVLALLHNLTRSRVGRALRSIHGAEIAANAMGVDTARYKLKAFVISAMLAAAAGSCMTHYTGSIGPSEAGAMKSVRYVALVAAGGMANLWGALVVSTVLTFLSLRDCFGTLDHAFFGVILILIIALAPQGPLKPLAAWIAVAWRAVRGERQESGCRMQDTGRETGSGRG